MEVNHIFEIKLAEDYCSKKIPILIIKNGKIKSFDFLECNNSTVMEEQPIS